MRSPSQENVGSSEFADRLQLDSAHSPCAQCLALMFINLCVLAVLHRFAATRTFGTRTEIADVPCSAPSIPANGFFSNR
jgi:hypothetical protein